MSEPELVLECPHCKECIVIEKLNCHIFRHGVLRENGKQMDPHSPKDVCNKLIENNQIFGCGKPFKVVKKEDGTYISEICEYI
jgi:hypothetical protein